MRKSLKLAMIVMVLGCAAAHADTLPRPTASYDADVTADIGANHNTAHVYAAGPKMQIALNTATGPMTLLVDRATSQIFMVMPALNTAMPVDRKTMGGYDLNSLNTIPLTPEAADSVNTVPATRYAVQAQIRNGTFSGHVWVTQDGAILQVEGTAVSGATPTPVKITLSNFQRRPQNPALFMLPRGTQLMPLGLAGLLQSPKGAPVPAR